MFLLDVEVHVGHAFYVSVAGFALMSTANFFFICCFVYFYQYYFHVIYCCTTVFLFPMGGVDSHRFAIILINEKQTT